MKKLLLMGIFLFLLTLVNAYPQDKWVQGPGGIWMYSPRVEGNMQPLPYSVLQAWHEAQRTGANTDSVRTIGRDHDPIQLRLVKPLDIKKRWDRTGYTAVYDIARQTIVPWQPNRVV